MILFFNVRHFSGIDVLLDPPGDLDAEKKRWLIVGICLHSIISPLLRKYVDPIVSNLYNVLVSRKSFDTQSFNGHLEKEPPSNKYFLNYESINNNMGVPKIKKYNTLVKDYQKYDYKVRSHVDFSKLFLQPNMALYSAFDDSCDSSALLGMIINISSFPTAVRIVNCYLRSSNKCMCILNIRI